MSVRFHPVALVTFVCLVLAFGFALQFPRPLQWVHLAALTCFASPLLLLLWAHARVASNWRQHLWLAFVAVPLACLSYFAVFLMGWFQAGWYGVAAFTALLLALAGLSLLPLWRKKGAASAA
jgi:hypothetical protein